MSVPYPFDPLSKEEQELVIATILPELGTISDVDEWDIVALKEPPKKEMLAYMNGLGPMPQRQAEATFYFGECNKYYEFIVNLYPDGTASVEKITLYEGSHPPYSCVSDNISVELLKTNPDFVNAMHKRGLTDYDIEHNIYFDVSPDSRLDDLRKCLNCKGPYAILDRCPRPRVFALSPYWNDGDPDSTSAYIQPIGGVVAWIDRRNNTVIGVYDGDVYPIVKGELDWNRFPEKQPPLKDLIIDDKDPSFVIDPNDEFHITWQGWSMRYAPDTTFGLILRDIKVTDYTVDYNNPVVRDLIYRVNISEYITGYASNDIPSKARNFFDVREFPAREYMCPLTKGIDVPEYATMKSAWFTYADGSQFEVEDCIAIYEQDGGLGWRHMDYSCSGNYTTRGRRNRQLVIAYTLVIGNYDYGIYYIFNEDYSIDFEVKLTGILECDATYKTYVEEEVLETGTLMRRYINAPNHWHAFSLRLDPSVDGQRNTVLEADIHLEPVSELNPCGNIFTETQTILPSVHKAIRDHKFKVSRKWVVVNENSTTNIGHKRGYELSPYPMARPFANPKSRIVKRALYLQHNLFVTKYEDDQFYVTGKYPVENCEDQGLARYTKEDKNLVNEDVVLWYMSGMCHSPTTEQYPVMPCETIRVRFAPHDFFQENPMLNITPDKLKLCCETQ